jgi:hypothetical protein
LLQLFVELVSEAASFFRLLFTPSTLYINEGEGERFDKYRRVSKKKGNNEGVLDWLEICRSKTWASFDKPKGDPDWSKVSNTLLDEFDKLNCKMLKGQSDVFRYQTIDQGYPYWDAVRKLLKKYVVKGSDEDDEVASQIINKLTWYLSPASDLDHRLLIPILTPNMLEVLAIHISTRAKAYEEVSE